MLRENLIEFLGRHFLGFDRDGIFPFSPVTEVDEATAFGAKGSKRVTWRILGAGAALRASYDSSHDFVVILIRRHITKVIERRKAVKREALTAPSLTAPSVCQSRK